MSRNVSSLAHRLGIAEGLYVQQQKAMAPEAQAQLADQALVGPAVIASSQSFYDFMAGENAQKRAYICNGSSCLCRGQQDSVRQALTDHLPAEEIGEMTCLGHCHQGGAFMLDGQTYDLSHLPQLAELLVTPKEQTLLAPAMSLCEPVLSMPFNDIHTWYAPLLSAIAEDQTEALLEAIQAAKLRGRGGAGFPAGIKWQACRDQISSEKYIVCNADEGDPGAFSDRYLLEHHPHSVIFGMLLAGAITGAREGVIYLRLEYPGAQQSCQKALSELKAAGILGQPLNERGYQFDLHLIIGSGAYICGEETALLRSIEGQRPVVSVRPPFPVQEGLFGQPTVVNNVETFACCPWIVAHDGQAFAALGTEQSAGVKLVCLDHCFNRPGVYEVAMGTPLSRVIEQAGGYRIPLKALHIGGPLGGVVPLSKVAELELSFESFAGAGFLLGHASIIGIPESMSMLSYLEHLFTFTAHESCGKCFPCRLGATRGQEMLASAQQGQPLNAELFEDLLETMALGSLCALGGGVPLPARNILEYFGDEIYSKEAAHD